MFPRDFNTTRGLRARLLSGLAALALTASCMEAHHDDPAAGAPPGGVPLSSTSKVVASFQVAAPTVPELLVRATIPIPPGVMYPGQTTTPLGVLDPSGKSLKTQVEVVGRYPDPGDGASVIEVMAIDPGATEHGPGPLTYLVHTEPSPRLLPPAQPQVPDLLSSLDQAAPEVQSLLGQGGQVLLAARDVFGNLYVLDLVHETLYDQGAREVERFGPLRSEYRHHGLMRPVAPDAGPTGTLPRLFGVHSYLRVTSGDPVVELDLRLHNGADGSTPDNEALNHFYFSEVALLVPKGWRATASYQDPSVGPAFGYGSYAVHLLVAPNADGKPHYMPELGQLHRRVVLAPMDEPEREASHLSREGLGFARPGPGGASSALLWSWWNPATANYFTQRHQLPRLAQIDPAKLEAELSQGYGELRDHLALGTGQDIYPVMSGDLGWAHPFGVAYGGMTGGDGIEFLWGVKTLVSASRDGFRRFEVLHRMNTERMPDALYRIDGHPSRVSDWVQTSSVTGEEYLDFYFYMHPTGSSDPWGFSSAPTFQNDHVANNGLEPSYEAALSAYEHYDIQHLVRYTGPAKALVWMGNDSLAKDDLELQAELGHLSYHSYQNSAYGHVQGTGLRYDQDFVKSHPQQGFPFGRGEGWTMDTLTASYVLGDDEFRARKLPWLQDVADLLVAGQETCSGFIQAEVYQKILGGKYRARQVFEESIVQNAAYGLLRSGLEGRDPLRAVALRDTLGASLYALIGPQAWHPTSSEPWSQTALGPTDLALPGFCASLPVDGNSGVTDAWQQWASLAYGLEISGDPAFLVKAELMLGMPIFYLAVEQDLSSLGNRAALHALVEFILDSL